MNWLNGRRCQAIAALTATGWAILCQATVARGEALEAQAEGAAAVEAQSGMDFFVPGLMVVVLFGISIYAVCRSSRRV